MCRRTVAVGFGIGTRPGRLEELLEDIGHSQVVHRRVISDN